MDDRIYQNIFSHLEPALPKDWKKIVFRADYTEGSYSMNFYVDPGDGDYTDCYSLPGVEESQIIKIFISINHVIASERKLLPSKEKWSIMTMTVNADGDFQCDFDYQDISENVVSYQQEWSKKYLNR